MKGNYPPTVYHGFTAEMDAHVRAEQAGLLCRAAPLSLTMVTVITVVLVVVNWGVVPPGMLLGWLACIVVLSLWRVWTVVACMREKDRRDAYWHRRLSAGALAMGFLWGAASWLLFPLDSPVHQTVVTMVLVGIAGGAVATLSGHRSASLMMVALILLPLAARWATMGSMVGMALAALALVLGVIIAASALRVGKNITQNIELRIQAAAREKALRESEVRFERLFESSPLGLAQYDVEGNVVAANEALARIVGVERKTILGFNLLRDIKDEQLRQEVRRSLAGGSGSYQGIYESVTVDKRTPVRSLLAGLPDSEGGYCGGFAIVEDITEQQAAQREIERQALYDPLTELPNRRLLLEQLSQELARAKRHGHKGALLFLDLDHFKTINDSLGHRVGDLLLQAVAQRLREHLRREDIAARLGGDEFVVVLSEVSDDEGTALTWIRERAEGLARMLAEPYELEGHQLPISASIGVTLFPNEANDADALLQHADAAMYRAKGEGRNTVRFFHKEMQEAADTRLAIEQALRSAPTNGELRLFFQPQVDASGVLLGAEALLRWQHPDKGLIMPGEFISVAEEVGLVGMLGEWVLEEVCRWLAAQGSGGTLPVAINISPKQFQHRDFVSRTRDILKRTSTDPRRIELEITEGVLLKNTDEAAAKMRELQALGISFAIDDFGTGYSSLSYLKRLPVNRLKIDRSFVRDIASDANDAAIVDTILSVANHLGLSAVAEGVENRGQFQFLRDRGCTVFQGYYFGRPVEAERFEDLL